MEEKEICINLFGEPIVKVNDETVQLGVALELLVVLILGRADATLGVTEMVKMLYKEAVGPDSKTEDPSDTLRKRKKKLKYLLGLEGINSLKPSVSGPEIVTQANVDVVQFERLIHSADSQDVLEAIALRGRGPLLANWQGPDIVVTERAVQEMKYQEALRNLIHEKFSLHPKEAKPYIDLLLKTEGLPEKEKDILLEQQMSLIFQDKSTGGDKAKRAVWPGKVPNFPTELLGREAQIEVLQKLLTAPGLVTLTGTAGIGKTRLAASVAQCLEERFSDGAGFIDLTTSADAKEMDSAIRSGLGLMEETGRPRRETLLSFLEDRHLLLVWDNCEHLTSECELLASEVLRRCPTVRLLVTSRETLHTDGERVFHVPPLTDDAVVRLFQARAQDVWHGFQITPENRDLVLKICRALDNLPLAIRLAAALVGSKKVEWIAKNLDKRFALLVDGPRGSSPHHVSLQAAFDLSYSLLSPAGQSFFRTLGVFSGSFSEEAAETVAATPSEASLLKELVRKSLVTTDEDSDEMRYRLLASLKQYSEERLQENGEWEEARRRHRDFFLALAEEAEPQLKGPEQKQWLDRLEMEHDNLRAAMAWKSDEIALRIACALQRFWWVRGHAEEGRKWLERDIKEASDQVRAKALIGAGRLAYIQGKFQEAKTMFEKSLAVRTHLKDKWGIANAWYNIGDVAFALGEYETAKGLFQDSLSQFQELGDKQNIAGALLGLGIVEVNQGQYLAAESRYKKSLELQRELNDPHGIADALRYLSNVAFRQGALMGARGFIEESLEQYNRLDNKERITECQIDLGRIALAQGNSAEAKKCFDQSLTRSRISGQQMVTVYALNYLASIADEQCDYEEVRELLLQSLILAQRMEVTRVVTILTLNLGLVTIRLGRNSEGEPLISEGLQKLAESRDKESIASTLEQYAAIIAVQGQNTRAVKLWGASATLSDVIGYRRPANEDAQYHSDLQKARTALGQKEFELAWEVGQAMSWEQAVAYALKDLP